MLKNYILTALRGFRKNKMATTINILGLTVGLSSCLLIALFIRHELSYDDFEAKGPRIVRVIMEYKFDGGAEFQRGNFTATKVATTFKRVFPEVEASVRMSEDDEIVTVRDRLFHEMRFMYADSSFFNIFSIPLLQGDMRSALSGPGKAVLTAMTARRYFGDADPVGKTIRVGTDSSDYSVTGVIAEPPSNSQIKFDLIASFSSLHANQDEYYWDANYTTFLLLHNPSDLATLQPKVTAFMQKEMKGSGATINFLLEPFQRIHLYSPYAGFEPGTSIVYIYILAGVALLILVIAGSTYINLSTARSVDRAREVGVRKVIGAGKGQLFWQFIGESLLLCLLAVVLSLAVVAAVLPAFDRLAERELSWRLVLSPVFIALAFGVAFLVGLLAGSYPALVLSRFHPVKVLKRAFRNTASGQGLRQSLIVFQFVISVFLIVATFVMGRQLSYIRHRDLGYDREHVVQLPMDPSLKDQIDYIKTEFLRNPDVVRATVCASSPVSIVAGYNMRNTLMPENRQLAVNGDPIDQDFIATTGLKLVAGESITRQDMRDAHPLQASGGKDSITKPNFAFVLNETAARELGWSPKEAVGKRMFMDGSRPGFVRGVVKDFNFQSLHSPIKGLVLFPSIRTSHLLVRITGEHLPQTLAYLETTWKRVAPGIPYEAHFLDENYNRLYAAEERLGTVMNLFSGIAIVLACLGLFGLSSYAAKQRVKEIGIRKVLGAPVAGLAMLLAGSFVRLAVVAMVIAMPLAAWAMHRWLQDFVYRAEMAWWVFVVAGLMVMVVTLATVSIQAVRTALINPVNNLRSE
ncbi:MAG TPA: ABC transporter permease [Puia sp.]|jgi:putative ABC transport system permease protein|nr:ABC transporter permease [Puia sp.]